jgi:hypothetical protein
MGKVAQMADYGGGGGDGPYDPRDVAIHFLRQQNAEFRRVMRWLLDSEGPEAGGAIAAAEALLDGLDSVEREEAADRERDRHFNGLMCDCGAYKGAGTSYCPECDSDTLARIAARQAELTGQS